MSERKSLVYFISPVGGGPIKIGFSYNLRRRLSTIQTASPVKLELRCSAEGGRESELALHAAFIEHWLHGEWFRPVPTLIALVDQVAKTGMLPDPPKMERVNAIRRRDVRPWSAERRSGHALAMRAYHTLNRRRRALAMEFGMRGSRDPYGDARKAMAAESPSTQGAAA